MTKVSKTLLLLICAVFLFTRLYKISEVPPSVYWDEASIGYNAYSISQDGRDEWGKFLPIHFRAFGEFKLPVYIYAVAPFIKIFSLNEFSTRIPAVLFSLGVVIITFFLAKKLSGNESMGLWSSFFVTISPWFFIFSRNGYEATSGLMFYLVGIYLFLFSEKRWLIVFSTVSFIISIYSYNSFRIISPLTILLLFVFMSGNLRQKLRKNLVPILISIILLAAAAIPIYRLYKYDAGTSRLQVVGGSLSSVIPNYFSHFDPYFLFVSGDKNLRSQQPNFGQLNFMAIILLPLGLLSINKLKYGPLVFIAMLIAPIPAALTKESPHALRSISMIPFISIITAGGIVRVKKYLKVKYLVELTVVTASLIFFANYFLNFIGTYPIQSSKDWQFGYKNVFTTFRNQFALYDHIIISDQYAQPYIFGLYYLKYDVDKFRQEVVRNSVDQWGFSTVKSFNKFIFEKITYDNLPKGKSLIFATPIDKLNGILQKQVIFNLDNSVAFYVYDYEK